MEIIEIPEHVTALYLRAQPAAHEAAPHIETLVDFMGVTLRNGNKHCRIDESIIRANEADPEWLDRAVANAIELVK
jgi:hypothetical protein